VIQAHGLARWVADCVGTMSDAIPRPTDTTAIMRRILKQLERRCSPGGYDDLVMVSDSDRLR